MLLLREKHTGSERSGHYFPRYHKSEFIFSFSCVLHHECPEAALCSPELQKALKWDYGSCGSFVPVVPAVPVVPVVHAVPAVLAVWTQKTELPPISVGAIV